MIPASPEQGEERSLTWDSSADEREKPPHMLTAPLVCQFASKTGRRPRCRGARLCRLASKPTGSNPPPPPLPLFRMQSKGRRKHMQSCPLEEGTRLWGSCPCDSPSRLSLPLRWLREAKAPLTSASPSAARHSLGGLPLFVLTGTAPRPPDAGLTVKDNGASWDRCHPCQ